MRLAVVVLVCAVALAGCIGGQGGGSTDPAAANGSSNDTELAFDRNVSDNKTIGDAHVHDPWGAETVKEIFDGSVQTEACPRFSGLTRPAVGCADVDLDNGTLVPQGTGKIQVIGDASDALERGGWSSEMWTNDNFYDGEVASEAQHTWWYELSKHDWDEPHQRRTGFDFEFYAEGRAAVLDGQIELTIRAHKIPNWTPPLAQAHIDHWKLYENHTFVENGSVGAIETLNTTVTYRECPFATDYAGQCEDNAYLDIPLSDIVPPGTVEVALGARWTVDSCPVRHDCDIDVDVEQGNDAWAYKEPVEEGDTYAIYTYTVPEDIVTDGYYANESITEVELSLYDCTSVPELGPACGLGTLAQEAEADVDLYMEAWNATVDMAAFKDRRGIG